MTKVHSLDGFAEHFIGLLKKDGTTGNSGTTSAKLFNDQQKSGTEFCNKVLPVNSDRYHPASTSGTAFAETNQHLNTPVTSVTSGTAIFAGGEDEANRGGAPAQWHAILAELELHNCPDWLTPERWNFLLADAENFLTRWGAAASALCWSDLDLFGIHPVAPANRFDAMGLLLLVLGGTVTALTADTAVIKRPSGAVLSYRRSDGVQYAVLLPEVLS